MSDPFDDPNPVPGPDDDEIRLTLPALAHYARVARLAIAGLAARNGFSYDEVEDLRIAVGELFGVLVEPENRDHQLTFTCQVSPEAISVTASRTPPAAELPVTNLTRQILEAVVDRADIDAAHGRFQIVKAARP